MNEDSGQPASTPSAHTLTRLLRRFSGGDQTVADEMLRSVLPELHRIATGMLRRQHGTAAFQPHDLIHEAWAKNLHRGGWKIENRQHFYAIAALAMRNVLIDYARSRTAHRRGSGVAPVDLSRNTEVPHPSELQSVVAAGLAMERLEKRDPASARIVDMHYFAGFTLKDIAEITGLKFTYVRQRWEFGRDWLKDSLLK